MSDENDPPERPEPPTTADDTRRDDESADPAPADHAMADRGSVTEPPEIEDGGPGEEGETDEATAPGEGGGVPEPDVVQPGGIEEPAIGRATAVMAVGTTLSRVTGVIRIVAVVYALGADSHLADAYNLANTMPNIIHDIVLGGVLSATFIPVFVHRLTTRPDDEAWEAISAVTSVTLIVIAAASVVFVLLAPFIIDATTALNHSARRRRTGGWPPSCCCSSFPN
jgi:putative peptidoglycan lipid II flippase